MSLLSGLSNGKRGVSLKLEERDFHGSTNPMLVASSLALGSAVWIIARIYSICVRANVNLSRYSFDYKNSSVWCVFPSINYTVLKSQ